MKNKLGLWSLILAFAQPIITTVGGFAGILLGANTTPSGAIITLTILFPLMFWLVVISLIVSIILGIISMKKHGFNWLALIGIVISSLWILVGLIFLLPALFEPIT